MIKIKVTQYHIDRGIIADACSCPVALALKDMGYSYPEVDHEDIFFDDKHHYVNPTIRNILSVYDETGVMQPFEFEVEHDS